MMMTPKEGALFHSIRGWRVEDALPRTLPQAGSYPCLRMLFVSLGQRVYLNNLFHATSPRYFTRTHRQESALGPESCAMADAGRSLSDLPEELQGRVLSFLGVADLCRASAATLAWRNMAQECAEQRACAIVASTYRGRSRDATRPCWIRILETCEALEEAVGRPPARLWKEEWVPMQLQHLHLRAVAAGPEAEAR